MTEVECARTGLYTMCERKYLSPAHSNNFDKSMRRIVFHRRMDGNLYGFINRYESGSASNLCPRCIALMEIIKSEAGL
jgi:hypothetical protein